jgi:hypothetical protein
MPQRTASACEIRFWYELPSKYQSDAPSLRGTPAAAAGL